MNKYVQYVNLRLLKEILISYVKKLDITLILILSVKEIFNIYCEILFL